MTLQNAILKIGQSILGAQDLEVGARKLVDYLVSLFDLRYVSVFSVSSEGNPSLLYGQGLENEDGVFNISLLGLWEDVASEVWKRKGVVVKRVEEGEVLASKLGSGVGVLGVPLISSKGIKGILVVLGEEGTLTPDLAQKLQALAVPLTGELVNSELYSQLEELFLSTILALASAVDAKHPYTRGHSERVTRYSVAIGREMELNKEEVKHLRISALLHDVGKIGISEAVLDKSGKLTAEEYEKIKQHPVIGAEIVGKIANSNKIVPGILDHHERYDGKGYPNGKKGDEISLFGRIIAVADTFDAMTSTRSYRKALPFQVAVEEIVYNAGYQFDPKVVKYFVKAYEKEKDIWQRENIILSVR